MNKKINFVLRLHYDGSYGSLFDNGVNLYQCKTKDSN